MTASVVPGWLFVAAGAGAVGVLMTAVTLYNPAIRIYAIPAMMLLLVCGLAAYAWRAKRELEIRAALQAERSALRQERDAARLNLRGYERELIEQKIDPAQILAAGATPECPAVLSAAAAPSATELATLAASGRQVIVFVPAATPPHERMRIPEAL